MNELSIIKRKNLKTKSWKTIKDDVYGKQGTERVTSLAHPKSFQEDLRQQC